MSKAFSPLSPRLPYHRSHGLGRNFHCQLQLRHPGRCHLLRQCLRGYDRRNHQQRLPENDNECPQRKRRLRHQRPGFRRGDQRLHRYLPALSWGGGTATPADGFSFNFAGNIPGGTMDETGAPSTGLTIEFHTYTNTTSGIGIHILWNGAILATNLMPVASLVTGTYTNVVIQLTTNGLVNVSYGNAIIYTNRALPGFEPMAGQFGLGARCGSDDENCWLDNLSINTTPILHPVVLADSPTGTNVVPNPLITVQLWDGSLSQVDQSTIQMMLDGTNVPSPTITESNALTVIQYAAPAVASGSSNWVMVTFSDNASPAVSYTNVFGFIAATYPTIPPSYMATADTTQPGFTERYFQGGTATVASTETADAMLAGLLLQYRQRPALAQHRRDQRRRHLDFSPARHAQLQHLRAHQYHLCRRLRRRRPIPRHARHQRQPGQLRLRGHHLPVPDPGRLHLRRQQRRRLPAHLPRPRSVGVV